MSQFVTNCFTSSNEEMLGNVALWQSQGLYLILRLGHHWHLSLRGHVVVYFKIRVTSWIWIFAPIFWFQCFMEPLKKVQVEGFLMYAEPRDIFGNLDELCYVRLPQIRFPSLVLGFSMEQWRPPAISVTLHAYILWRKEAAVHSWEHLFLFYICKK